MKKLILKTTGLRIVTDEEQIYVKYVLESGEYVLQIFDIGLIPTEVYYTNKNSPVHILDEYFVYTIVRGIKSVVDNKGIFVAKCDPVEIEVVCNQ